jgi:1,2-diacylglycerol 3-alpha-glucosyltransferase
MSFLKNNTLNVEPLEKMRILHCCLADFYADNYGYQQNILPRMHKLQGHEVAILASTETFLDNAILAYLKPSSYYTSDRIHITRVPYSKWFPHFLALKLRIYNGISKSLEKFKPDIIFIHGCQFISIKEIVSYTKEHQNVMIYVDGHADFINSATNWVSKKIMHGIIYKWCANKINPHTRKFYGTLPLRMEFIRTVYGISVEKIELLVLGADDSIFDLSKKDEIRKSIRKTLNIKDNDFVLVTGGKIDHRKNIHVLMKAVDELQKEDIKLIVFGEPNQQMKPEVEEVKNSTSIRYIGWIPSEKIYDYFLAADLAFFPGTHSVLWEQAVGVGLPCVFKKWDGMQHVDLNGNCLFINAADIKEIKEKIILLYQDNDLLLNMRQVAMDKGIPEFSYYEIARRAIE